MCWIGTRLGIWMNTETHFRMKDELRFGFGFELGVFRLGWFADEAVTTLSVP